MDCQHFGGFNGIIKQLKYATIPRSLIWCFQQKIPFLMDFFESGWQTPEKMNML